MSSPWLAQRKNQTALRARLRASRRFAASLVIPFICPLPRKHKRIRGAFPPLASRGGVYLFTETAWLHCRFLLEREAFAKLSEFFVIKSRCVEVDFLQSLYPV